jgi:glycine cleavage system aminomethyltransferase T
LVHGGREVGCVTSVIRSPTFARAIGLGYVRREVTDPGEALAVQTASGSMTVRLMKLPLLHDPISRFERPSEAARSAGR